MGLFDRVQIDVPMPGYLKPIPSAVFQTKAFDCQLEEYGIDAKGHLYKLITNDAEEHTKLYLTNYSGEVRLLSEVEAPINMGDYGLGHEYYVVIHSGIMVSARQEEIRYPKIIKESK